jgi:radical SAM protein with 4Fe4S-binding SPASM domain
MRNHRAAAYDAETAYVGIEIKPQGIKAQYTPDYLLKAATKAWDDAVQLGENESYSRYKKDEDNYQFKNKLLNHCWRLWHSCVITWDGKVVPCCFDKDGTYQLGNLGEKSFNDIWQSDNYKQFRAQILKGRQYIEICKNCSEGTSVWQN